MFISKNKSTLDLEYFTKAVKQNSSNLFDGNKDTMSPTDLHNSLGHLHPHLLLESFRSLPLP